MEMSARVHGDYDDICRYEYKLLSYDTRDHSAGFRGAESLIFVNHDKPQTVGAFPNVRRVENFECNDFILCVNDYTRYGWELAQPFDPKIGMWLKRKINAAGH